MEGEGGTRGSVAAGLFVIVVVAQATPFVSHRGHPTNLGHTHTYLHSHTHTYLYTHEHTHSEADCALNVLESSFRFCLVVVVVQTNKVRKLRSCVPYTHTDTHIELAVMMMMAMMIIITMWVARELVGSADWMMKNV